MVSELREGRASGVCGIPAELLEAGRRCGPPVFCYLNGEGAESFQSNRGKETGRTEKTTVD